MIEFVLCFMISGSSLGMSPRPSATAHCFKLNQPTYILCIVSVSKICGTNCDRFIRIFKYSLNEVNSESEKWKKTPISRWISSNKHILFKISFTVTWDEKFSTICLKSLINPKSIMHDFSFLIVKKITSVIHSFGFSRR